ncbi:nephrin isoform X1 [Onthophagus taurus]|uniref:nephrin isoform X1 n=1 Tax=Onthophagus taurus TaxID=166361 RepID=UPI0039BE73B4
MMARKPLGLAIAVCLILVLEHFSNVRGIAQQPKGTFSRTKRAFVTHVQAIVGGTAELPCDLTPPAPNDSVLLVVWYKDEHLPIYSYDTRVDNVTAKHWREDNIDTRAFFRVMTEPSTLVINNIIEKDEGEYRCRIDYQRSPTKNHRVKVTVIVPPEKPSIYDEKGNKVLSTAGPYDEGGDVKLTCIVTGGKPEPIIKWWRGQTLIDSMDTRSNFPKARSNQLVIRNLQRSDQQASFTCQAANNNISQPVSASTSLVIYFRPLKVEILSSNQPLSADRRYEIPCQAFGSKPAVQITWSLDKKELKLPMYNSTQTDSDDGNMSTSTLVFTPTRLDNGRTLTCRAANHFVQNGIEETSIKLNVFYVPILHLSLGSNLNPNDIEEKDDVYFECKVNANPGAYKVVWKHNGQILQQNQKMGIIINSGGENLALQSVKKGQAGNYTCVASNVEGDGDSNSVELKVMYLPVCKSDQKRIYGVARHENAKVYCEVESYPVPTNFKWSFNNSAERNDVPPERYKFNLTSSTLTYTPITELDYGTVMCWAENTVGLQLEPCVFHIIAAGKPDPPHNCSILNQTTESLEVECVESFDGGQQQYFLLEVFDEQTNILQANVSAKFPLFTISGLESGKILRMLVFAANSKGRSEAVVLEGFTLKVAEKQIVLSLGTRDQIEIAPILGILVGIVTVLLLITVVILGAMKIRTSQRNGGRAFRPGFLPVKEKVTLPLRSDSEDLFEKDDKNPDVVPANKDSNYQLGSAAQTPGLNNSVTSTDYEVASTAPQTAHITPLQEAYIARDRSYTPQHMSNEVTYAELSLVRPNSLDPVKNGGGQYGTLRGRTDDSTIYAQIDHSKKLPPAPVRGSLPSPLISPASLFPTAKTGIYQREIVTVRTPLMGCQQESCV